MSHKKVIRINPLDKALPKGGCDSHAHLDSECYNENRAEIIKTAMEAGITYIGNIFLSPQAYNAHKGFFKDYPNIFFILGIHPCDGLTCTSKCLEEISDAFKNDSNIKAVGEIGLDYHWDDCPQELQRRAFAMQIEMAKNLSKPIVIHCRDAEADCLTILEAGGFKDYPLLWHCFGGDKSLAKRILHNGWHISIPGPVTYPANKDLREAVTIIPRDKLLLETDCPYLSPAPWRGTPNQPAYTVFTAREVAAVKNIDPEELWQICGNNARNFFGI